MSEAAAPAPPPSLPPTADPAAAVQAVPLETAPMAATTLQVTTPDGLRIAARIAAPAQEGEEAQQVQKAEAAGPDLLFIHGFSQSGLCWNAQMESPLLRGVRKVAYDFRGHGASDKPLEAAFYQEAGRWADELEAVIAQAGLRTPVLVGWSYAGRIIADYLRAKGPGGIGGIVFVDAAVRNDRHFYGTSNKLMRLMCAEDLPTQMEATRAFLRNCFAVMPGHDLFERLLATNMVVPPPVRANLFGRAADYDDLLAGLALPVLVVQGGRDQVVAPAMARHIADTVPGARLVLMDEVGHAPFIEAAESFNALLADFLAEVGARQRPAAP